MIPQDEQFDQSPKFAHCNCSTIPTSTVYRALSCCPSSRSVLPIYYNFSLVNSLDFSACPPLPMDPRRWSRIQVARWCDSMSQMYGLWPPIDVGHFPFNGHALCLLNDKMWAIRTPDYWQLLQYDIRRRMCDYFLLENCIDKATIC